MLQQETAFRPMVVDFFAISVATPVAIRKALSPPRIVYSWPRREGGRCCTPAPHLWGRLSPVRLARMIGEVQDVIDRQRDSVIVYRFPGRIQDATLRV